MSPQEPTRTIWTKSLFDGLYMALERNDPRAVKAAMADLAGKDFPRAEVMRHVIADQGEATAKQLETLLSAPAAQQSEGLIGRLKNLFS